MFSYIALGIIQGLTEFLPVSSSAHLLIIGKILRVNHEVLAFSVVLHLGTTLALILFFFKDILVICRSVRTTGLIFITTAITGAIGVSGKKFFEQLFSLSSAVSATLVVTGVVLFISRRFMQGKRNTINVKDAVILGFTQGLAIVPGISRSGITIATLLSRGVERSISFSFSFIASIPAVLGAALLEAKDIHGFTRVEVGQAWIGFLVSFVTGLVALKVLRFFMAKAKLHYFGFYCILIAILTFIFIR